MTSSYENLLCKIWANKRKTLSIDFCIVEFFENILVRCRYVSEIKAKKEKEKEDKKYEELVSKKKIWGIKEKFGWDMFWVKLVKVWR